jgi:hypothetical protein
MASFNYFEGIREDFGNMVDEIGTSCIVEVPTIVVDSFGNHVTMNYVSFTENIWVRQLNEVMEVQGIGQLNKEDIRFVAKFDTNIVIESRLTYNGVIYIVLGFDKPNESGNYVNRVGYGKKQLT